MSDVRADIKRAMRDADQADPLVETAKGVAVVGGGLLAGRYIGKRIMRAMQKGNLTKNALDHVRMNDAVHDVVRGQSNFDRFRAAGKARRK